MKDRACMASILDAFQEISNKPETFVGPQEDFTDNLRQLVKDTYDFVKEGEFKPTKSDALPELIIHNFDLEQIWQQLELQNNQLLDRAVSDVSKLAVAKDRLLFSDIQDEQNEAESSSSSSDEQDQEDLKDEENDLEDQDELDENSDCSGSEGDGGKKVKSSEIDDKFFKLDEMNNFLLSQEKKINKTKTKKNADSGSESESENSIDMFKATSDEEESDFEGNDKERNPRYKDFFRNKNRQQFEEENENKNDSEKTEDDDQQKSSLELREERLKKKIQEFEDAAVSEKPWQLKGEVTAEKRPQNSLLQEVLEFDLISRPAPVITEETTHLLEDVIRQRIKDKAFDDVERKEKPVETPLEFKKKLLLDQEKSKESLAQIYEKEYLKAANPEPEDKEEEEPQLHKEIKSMMHSLFTKLDALSNFHFTPKPVAPELKVVNNLPAINMEEVAPVAASDAALLAPEEVKPKTKGDIIGKSERTATDKKRERRKKKLKQRAHANERKKKEGAVKNMKVGLGNKYSKEKTKKMIERISKETNVDKMDESLNTKSIKSSTAFFTELQEQVKSQIHSKRKLSSSKSLKMVNAKKMKL